MFESRQPQRFNPTDATLWAIKRDPELRTTIVGLVLLDRSPDWATFVHSIRLAVQRIPRLRQRVSEPPLGFGRPRWVDTRPDLGFHLRRTTLAEPDDGRELLDLVGNLAGQDFDADRPLWQMYLVEGLADDRAAVVMKISHSLTDGVGGMGLLRAMADDPGAESGDGTSAVGRPRKTGGGHGPKGAGLPRATELIGASARAGRHPIRTVESTVTLTESAARMLAPAGRPLSPLMTERGSQRWAGTSELPLERLRRAAHRADGTINDALVTIALGALADYHVEQGSDATRFRVTLPVSLRPAPDPLAAAPDDSEAEASTGSGGNQWAPARLVLDVDRLAHPFAQLRSHQQVLRTAIHEPAIPFTQVLAAGILELPPALTTSIVGGMVKGSDIAISDVPGLTEPLTIAGSRLTHFFPFAPTGGAALNIGLVSHLDKACIGFTIDPAAITEPDRLVRCFDDRAADFLRRRKAPAAKPDRTPDGPKPRTTPTTETTEPDRAAGGRDRPLRGGLPAAERLSALDTGFLRLESPTTPMHMGGLFVIEGRDLFDSQDRFDIEALRRHVEHRLDRMPHLRRTVREIPLELGRPVWVDHPGFDIAQHVQLRSLPAPGSRTQLFELCQELQMELLDRSRPLFDLTFVDGLDPAEFGPHTAALVERVHHALLDGMSGVEMVALLFDSTPATTSRKTDVGTGPSPTRAPGSLRLMVDAAVERAREPLALAGGTVRAITQPRKTAGDLGRVVGTVADLLRPDRLGSGPFDHPVGAERRLRSVSVPLDLVHETGLHLGGSVNDVVLTAVSRGVRSLLDARAESVPDSFVALVPVSTRHRGMVGEHGNQVAALTVELPIGEADLQVAFTAVSDRMKQLKAEHQAEGSEILLDAADHLPPLAVDLLARLVSHQRSVDVVVTNLPGPPEPLFLGRSRVREMIPILPLGGNLTIGVAVFSYDGNLIVAFNDGDDQHDDLDVITEATEQALLDLAAVAGISSGV